MHACAPCSYLCYLFFQLKTHADLFQGEETEEVGLGFPSLPCFPAPPCAFQLDPVQQHVQPLPALLPTRTHTLPPLSHPTPSAC